MDIATDTSNIDEVMGSPRFDYLISFVPKSGACNKILILRSPFSFFLEIISYLSQSKHIKHSKVDYLLLSMI